MDEYTLAIAFDTDDAEFCRGVEVGMIYGRLLAEPRPVLAVVHASNAEMMLRLAEATSTSVRSVDLDEDWLEVTFSQF